MAYTVKQVAAMSGVSVRTLHFYDEVGLLKPAYHGANGYRFINVFQPAGNMEEFFRKIGKFKNLPTREDVINEAVTEDQIKGLGRIFEAHGMDLLPPLGWRRAVE